jgi:hypothetical protein
LYIVNTAKVNSYQEPENAQEQNKEKASGYKSPAQFFWAALGSSWMGLCFGGVIVGGFDGSCLSAGCSLRVYLGR